MNILNEVPNGACKHFLPRIGKTRHIPTWQGMLDICPSFILSWSSLRSELNMSSSPMYAQSEWYLQETGL